MRERAIAALGALALCACTSEEWALPEPCAGEDDERICAVRKIDVDGVERRFIVSHLTADDCASGPLPIVFGWHGSGGNGQELREFLEVERALGGAMAFVYPDGLPRKDTDGRTGWNRDPEGDDVAFFDALLDTLAEDACLDVERVFSVGHSRGGRFVEVLGCVRGGAHRAFASIAAGSNNVDGALCTESAPVWLTHGVDDETVWFFEGELVRDAWAERNGCDDIGWFDEFPLNTCTTLEGCEKETVFCPSDVEQWRGHAPPSFAGDAIASFFLRHE